jgi:hypothetical protein
MILAWLLPMKCLVAFPGGTETDVQIAEQGESYKERAHMLGDDRFDSYSRNRAMESCRSRGFDYDTWRTYSSVDFLSVPGVVLINAVVR